MTVVDLLDMRDVSDAPVRGVPWHFVLGRFLSRHKIRGGDRLIIEARKRGLLDILVPYHLGRGIQLNVPLWRPSNTWDEADVFAYEADLLRMFAGAITKCRGAVTLVDCGADIGIVSASLVARCPNISAVIAFEPNAAAHRVLARNLAGLPVRSEAHHAAVGDFRGRGELVSSDDDASAFAMHVARAEEGAIAVQLIDDLGLPTGTACAIKIDVEGSEPAVVAGAAHTIARASEVVVAFEAHPVVLGRLKQDPVDLMRDLLALRRDFRFELDFEARVLSTDRPFFQQVPPTRVYNVVASAISGA